MSSPKLVKKAHETIHTAGEWLLLKGVPVEVPTWQALDVTDAPQGRTIEVCDLSLYLDIPPTMELLQEGVEPNLPFAEAQFQDRVSGKPLNPPPSHELWPWARHNAEHQKEEKFSHTYPERYWPKHAGGPIPNQPVMGIREYYGDLSDVVSLLARQPTTRQAYLPVFFPEDTGAVHGERIPCSLGYLFLMREGKLNITYYIRSCDYFRHFRDDVYMTARLCQWVCDKAFRKQDIDPGRLTMHIGSLHVFEGDLSRLRREYGED